MKTKKGKQLGEFMRERRGVLEALSSRALSEEQLQAILDNSSRLRLSKATVSEVSARLQRMRDGQGLFVDFTSGIVVGRKR